MVTQLVRVKVYPGARKEVWLKVASNQFEAYVREPAQQNMANMRVLTLVAREYGVPTTAVRMQAGARARGKTFSVILL